MANATTPNYRQEHPDIGTLDFPIPAGFTDSSWHNDNCPSWFDETHNLKLWIDYADPDLRDSGGPRFALQKYNSDHEFVEEILALDDYNAILEAIAKSRESSGQPGD